MKKDKVIISLGGGCLIATELRAFYLRQCSLPFDWLWNFDDGLGAVTGIINNDFAEIVSEDGYTYSSQHYMWPDKEMLVFAKYPNVALIHSNPLKSEHDQDALIRRVARFKELLSSQLPITFIYFRDYIYYREQVNNQAYNKIEVAAETWKKLTEESEAFIEMIARKFPINNFVLLSLFLAPPEIVAQIKNSNPIFLEQGGRHKNIIYDFIIQPNDVSSEDKAYQADMDKQFGELFLKYKLISGWYLVAIKIIIKIKAFFKKFKFIKIFRRKKPNFK
jgi:hypothetical protein